MGDSGGRLSPEPGRWTDLLTAATLAIDVRLPTGTLRGTGFLVAPGLVATCAHLLGEDEAPEPLRIIGRIAALGLECDLVLAPGGHHRDRATGLDLALLLMDEAAAGPGPVLVCDRAEPGDPLWAFGHPDNEFRAGQWAGLAFQGRSRRATHTRLELLRAYGTPVGPGFSGGPVVNERTGAVCGMICTSDQAGSAHLLPAGEILGRCPAAEHDVEDERAWLEVLSEQQLRILGRPFPGPRLRDYLADAARAAQAHPYPGVVAGVMPPLSAVYVRQQAERADTAGADGGPGHPGGGRLPADAVVTTPGDAVLVGRPGAGKSSLLRTVAHSLAGEWARGRGGGWVPVRLTAAELVPERAFPDTLAAGIRADLGAVGTRHEWTPDFFREPPAPGAGWLVLIDGLDEVMDAERRRRVLTKLAGLRAQDPDGALYRFVVATRPLPDDELATTPDWRPHRFQLLPLGAGQLPELAAAWFEALRMDDPAGAATRFVGEVDRLGLRLMAKTPLMATMLCQLFAADPGRRLPPGRYALYEAYVRLLNDSRYRPGTDGIVSQIRAAADQYRAEVTTAAERLNDRTFELVGMLAIDRLDGGTRPALELMAGWTSSLCPPQIPVRVWPDLVRDFLRRSGLLAERAGDFHFLHQTFVEFLAAQRVAADARRGTAAYRALFGRWGRAAPPGPEQDDSFSRFLIAAWHDRRDLSAPMRRWAADLTGSHYIAGLAADGTPLDGTVGEAALTTLRQAPAQALSFDARVEVLRSRMRLGDAAAGGTLEVMAADAGLSVHDRVWAAKALCERGDPRGVEALAAIASEPELELFLRGPVLATLEELSLRAYAFTLASLAGDARVGMYQRSWSWTELEALGPRRCADGLAAVAADPGKRVPIRVWAASRLREAEDARGLDALAALLADGDRDVHELVAVAEVFEKWDPRWADVLFLIATCTRGESDTDELGVSERARAAARLGQLHDERYPDALAALALGPHPGIEGVFLNTGARAWATFRLSDLGDVRAADALSLVASGADGDLADRMRAVESLVALGDPRGPAHLIAMGRDPGLPAAFRLRVATRLESAGEDAGHRDVLAALAEDPAAGPNHRLGAAVRLARRSDARGPRILTAMATGPELDFLTRARAAQHLVEVGEAHGAETLFDVCRLPVRSLPDLLVAAAPFEAAADPRHREVLATFVAGHRGELDARMEAAVLLASAGDRRGADFLAAVADGAYHGSAARLTAAEALLNTGDARAPDLLALIATDARGSGHGERIRAAGRLETIEDPRGRRALAELAGDPGTATAQRIAAATALQQLGDGAGTEALLGLATSAAVRMHERIMAAQRLKGASAALHADALASIAGTVGGDVAHRLRVAQALDALGDPRGGDTLAALAADPAEDIDHRADAARALAARGDSRGTLVLSAVAADPHAARDDRLFAFQVLVEIAAPADLAPLRQAAVDLRIPFSRPALWEVIGPPVPSDGGPCATQGEEK
ncbi:trypsin-like peptidase domain-containing protein [Streptomyces sp. NPDC014864]|uniref:trypsin-like peptidase domain-containing protein n=1 Tax=Streptomyces sp. NPDC014864 TaxID=3364924 RepID=UPI0036F5510C